MPESMISRATPSSPGAGARAGAVLAAFYTVSYLVIGAFVASRRPRHPVGWLLLGIGAGFLLDNVASFLAINGYSDRAPLAPRRGLARRLGSAAGDNGRSRRLAGTGLPHRGRESALVASRTLVGWLDFRGHSDLQPGPAQPFSSRSAHTPTRSASLATMARSRTWDGPHRC